MQAGRAQYGASPEKPTGDRLLRCRCLETGSIRRAQHGNRQPQSRCPRRDPGRASHTLEREQPDRLFGRDGRCLQPRRGQRGDRCRRHRARGRLPPTALCRLSNEDAVNSAIASRVVTASQDTMARVRKVATAAELPHAQCVGQKRQIPSRRHARADCLERSPDPFWIVLGARVDIPRPAQNLPRICPESTQNPPRIHPASTLRLNTQCMIALVHFLASASPPGLRQHHIVATQYHDLDGITCPEPSRLER
jgi:hypothetical protein